MFYIRKGCYTNNWSACGIPMLWPNILPMLLLLFVLMQYCNTLHVLNLSAVPVYFVQRFGSITHDLQSIPSLPLTLMLIYVVNTSIPIPGCASLYHVPSFLAHVAVLSSPAFLVKEFTKLLMTFVYWSNVLAVP